MADTLFCFQNHIIKYVNIWFLLKLKSNLFTMRRTPALNLSGGKTSGAAANSTSLSKTFSGDY
jgi:hypothetical protein